MQINITGKQMNVTPRLREIIERKVRKLARLVDDDARVEVTVTEGQTRSSRDRYSVQLALTNSSHPVRSEVSAANANIALDLVLDKVLAQLGRYKDRHTSAIRHRTPPAHVLSLSRSGKLSTLKEKQEQEEDTDRTGAQQSNRNDGRSNKQATSAVVEEHNEEIWSRVLEIRRLPTKPMDDQEVIAQMEAFGLSFLPFFNEATNSVNVMYRLDKGGYGLLLPELE